MVSTVHGGSGDRERGHGISGRSNTGSRCDALSQHSAHGRTGEGTMSHLVIVGASKGIGRDIQIPLLGLGHIVGAVARGQMPRVLVFRPGNPNALLLCQRWRHAAHEGDWMGEWEVSMGRTKELCEWAGQHMEDG